MFRKSSSRFLSATRRTLLLSASLAALTGFGLTSSANAACSGVNSGAITCTGTDATAIATIFSGSDVVSTLTDWTLSQFGFSSVVTTAHSNTVVATGASITNSSTTQPSGILASSNGGNVSVTASGGAIALTLNPMGEHGGIKATTIGTGNITIDNADTITTAGRSSFGILAAAESGAIHIKNSGYINTNAGSTAAIVARLTSGTGGSILIENLGDINAAGNTSTGIYASAGAATADTNIVINDLGNRKIQATLGGIVAGAASGSVTINSNSEISVYRNAAYPQIIHGISNTEILGDASITYNGPKISITMDGAGGQVHGLRAVDNLSTALTSNYAMKIDASGDIGINVINGSNVLYIYGAEAINRGHGSADLIYRSGTISIGYDATSTVNAPWGGFGLVAWSGAGNDANTGFAHVSLTTLAGTAINTTGNNLTGAHVSSLAGTAADGAYVRGNINSTITTTGSNSHGVAALAGKDAPIDLKVAGAISTGGDVSMGIKADSLSGTVSVANAAEIHTAGGGSHGISTSGNGTVAVANSGSLIAPKGAGVFAASFDATGGGTYTLTNQASGNISALVGVDISSGFSDVRIDNAGIIGGPTDYAIRARALTTGQLSIANSGTLNGYISLGASTNTLDNSGRWNLRNFGDRDSDGVREALRVAVANLGTSGANVVNNTGTIALLGRGDDTAQTLDTTGMYLPQGYAFNTMSVNSPTQGHIFGVQTFNNAGVIDLTANVENGQSVVGDVLVISGGKTAGQDGGGVFVSNGGTLRLDTVLNEGGANSQSDILVTDSTRLGTSATRIQVVQAPGSAGALTVGNGILLVEVLNKGASASGAFILNAPEVAGAYQYNLYQNGVDDSASDGNWYLRSSVVIDNNGNVVTDNNSKGETVSTLQPGVPVAMTLQPLALEYGYSMLGTLHERVGETWINAAPVTEERAVWCRNSANNNRCMVKAQAPTDKTRWASSGWARLLGDRGLHDAGNFFRHGPSYDYTFGGIQAGLDIFAHEQANGTLDKAGIYVGYGQLTSDVKDQFGGKAGTLDMNAYTVAGYWTHHAPQGWYTDAVVQATWYSDTDAKSVLGQKISPESFGILGSLEAGYQFRLGGGWTIDPQAQIVYQSVSFDDASDANARYRFDDADSLRGRFGVRVSKTWNTMEGAKARPVTAWLRANVWHEFMGSAKTEVSNIYGANAATFSTSLGGTWGELGAGLTVQASDTINIFATGAYQHSLDGHGNQGWNGRLGATVKW